MSLYKYFAVAFLLLGTAVKGQSLYHEDYSSAIDIGGVAFEAEIADTPEKLQKGMMYRPSMKANQAMVFIYPQPQRAYFWMKNTLIPLDMLFFDASGSLLEIKHRVPPCKVADCPVYPSKQTQIKYVVELKAGASETLGIEPGDKLKGSDL